MQEEKKNIERGHASINDLNKTQALLLSLFVAFVTSIASSIVTVTLLDQAPPAINQTINRIVEKTVEVAVPGKPIIERVREVPVIITEEDLIADAVRVALPAVVLIVEVEDTLVPSNSTDSISASTTDTAATSSNETDKLPQVGNKVLGMGFIASADGLIVTSADLSLSTKSSYVVRQITREKPKQWTAKFEYTDKKGFQLLRITDLKAGEDLPRLSFVDGTPSLGKTAFTLGSRGQIASVAVGSISSLREETPVSAPKVLTTISVGKENVGAPLLDTKGRVIGIVSKEGDAFGVAPILEYLSQKSPMRAVIDKKSQQ